jgi:hypothetical protein
MMHNEYMRTSVTLDDDVYQFASMYAGAKGITLSAAISELIRRAEQAPEPESVSPRLKMTERGYYVIVGGSPITSEMVKELSEDEID